MSRARKGLSYVLGDASDTENHILCINAMQYSQRRRQLYTAGRDGAVKVWSALEHPQGAGHDSSIGKNKYFENQGDLAETVLRLETSLSSAPLACTLPTATYNPNVTKSYNVHFDWVNDLKLVNDDRHLVSASADLSLKLIDIDGDERSVQKFENVHTDYVKKISAMPLQNALVSGGLDGRVVVWDMSRLAPVQDFYNSSSVSFTNSIYALLNDDGHLIAAGGPNNTVNLYDRRIAADANANLIRRLVGHQDNVRCLLMNSNYVLSGSSDSTIKLWDMRNFNVYKNFDAHDDAVWSLCTLASSGAGTTLASLDDFKEFYSGDRAGNIIKTDLNYLSTHSNYDEDDPFTGLTFLSADQAYIDEQIGLCTLVAKAPSPIMSLCAENDSSIFASCSNSLDRFHVPQTRDLAKYQYLRACVDYSESLERKFEEDLGTGLESAGDQSDLDSDLYDIISHLSVDTAAVDMASSMSGTRGALPQVPDKEIPSLAQYTSMFLSVSGGPSAEYVNAYKDEFVQEAVAATNEYVDSTPVEMLLNPIPPNQILTIPFNKAPFQEFGITPKSIVSKKMLSNKRHLVSLYVNGDIKIWDIFICKVIKLMPYKNSDRHLSSEELKERSKDVDLLLQNSQTDEVLTNWCEVYIRSGKILIILSETYIGNVEIYYDELVKDYPFLQADESISENKNPKRGLVVTNDSRFFLARIFLTSLFQKYCQFEWESDKRVRETLRESKPTLKGTVSSVDSVGTENEDNSKRKKLFSRVSSSIPRVKSAVSPAPSTASSLIDPSDKAVTNRLPAEFADDSIARMLRFNEHLYTDKYSIQGNKRCVDSLLKLYIDGSTLGENSDAEYRPVIPACHFPDDLLIIIYETSADLANFRDLYSFHLGDLLQLETCDVLAKNQLVDQLRLNMPKWIGAPILYNKFHVKEQPKISFQLFEIDYELLLPLQKIGGKAQKKIKKLPSLETSIKLSSHCMLRVSKVLQFLTEKFDSRTPEMKMKKPATEWLTLECKGRELDGRMTLQTIKTLIWKSSSDIELYYHRKYDP